MAAPDRYGLLKCYAGENKHNMTLAEEVLWEHLRNNGLGVKFRRQHIVGDYIVDFVCLKKWLVVEVDGEYHNTEEQTEEDNKRTEALAEMGFTVIRFANDEVLNEIERVLAEIEEYIDNG